MSSFSSFIVFYTYVFFLIIHFFHHLSLLFNFVSFYHHFTTNFVIIVSFCIFSIFFFSVYVTNFININLCVCFFNFFVSLNLVCSYSIADLIFFHIRFAVVKYILCMWKSFAIFFCYFIIFLVTKNRSCESKRYILNYVRIIFLILQSRCIRR